MRRISRPFAPLLILSVGAVVLFVAHGIVVFGLLSQTAVPVAVIAGGIALIVLKHLGLLSPLYSAFRKRFPRKG